jgi:hypothetical protein
MSMIIPIEGMALGWETLRAAAGLGWKSARAILDSRLESAPWTKLELDLLRWAMKAHEGSLQHAHEGHTHLPAPKYVRHSLTIRLESARAGFDALDYYEEHGALPPSVLRAMQDDDDARGWRGLSRQKGGSR